MINLIIRINKPIKKSNFVRKCNNYRLEKNAINDMMQINMPAIKKQIANDKRRLTRRLKNNAKKQLRNIIICRKSH